MLNLAPRLSCFHSALAPSPATAATTAAALTFAPRAAADTAAPATLSAVLRRACLDKEWYKCITEEIWISGKVVAMQWWLHGHTPIGRLSIIALHFDGMLQVARNPGTHPSVPAKHKIQERTKMCAMFLLNRPLVFFAVVWLWTLFDFPISKSRCTEIIKENAVKNP
mmetsp:Transcript_13785/g.24006  ORF Transcript_13785/g.24006 Transcript_13785/m.24006 type:complete len:167 (+) Transcript_13785:104-604(+)